MSSFDDEAVLDVVVVSKGTLERVHGPWDELQFHDPPFARLHQHLVIGELNVKLSSKIRIISTMHTFDQKQRPYLGRAYRAYP